VEYKKELRDQIERKRLLKKREKETDKNEAYVENQKNSYLLENEELGRQYHSKKLKEDFLRANEDIINHKRAKSKVISFLTLVRKR